MSVAESPSSEKTAVVAKPKPRRFHPVMPAEPAIALVPPTLSLDQSTLGELLPTEVLRQLARPCQADDERRRKLPCEVFFWLAVLAFGPGGVVKLKTICTYLTSARSVSGQSGAACQVSKEAVSENFRQRPWTFFEAALNYLLSAYDQLWQQLAGRPNAQMLAELQVVLVDATSLRVALQLVDVFPARPNGKLARWAGVKLHVALNLFSQVPVVVRLSPETQNELKNLSFLRPAGEAVLYIFDLGFWSFGLFDQIVARGQQFLSRVRRDCAATILAVHQGEPDWVGQRVSEIQLRGTQVDLVVQLGGGHHRRLQPPLRLVGCWLESEQVWHLYVTSLMERSAYPVALLADLYRLRWQIEIFFRNLKCVLRIANFVSLTENGVRIQIYAALIHYVLTHLVILQAMQLTGRPFEDFSIPYCLDAVQQVLKQSGELVRCGLPPNWTQLELRLVQAVLANGLRPNRHRPALITSVKARWPTALLPAQPP
jgi:Transposase DDE domain